MTRISIVLAALTALLIGNVAASTVAFAEAKHTITSPRDAATGQATGKRSYKPL